MILKKWALRSSFGPGDIKCPFVCIFYFFKGGGRELWNSRELKIEFYEHLITMTTISFSLGCACPGHLMQNLCHNRDKFIDQCQITNNTNSM